jgi:mRNA-degrading endonuclease RelE of RelBE toxin-antitoxin system
MEILYTEAFKRQLRRLSRKYRHIRSDLAPVIEKLKAGDILGDQIPGVDYTLYKMRVRNRDAQRGTQGGYRLIYHLKTTEQIVLITVYSKSDQSDIDAHRIREIIAAFEAARK